jgi:hypothetical protein
MGHIVSARTVLMTAYLFIIADSARLLCGTALMPGLTCNYTSTLSTWLVAGSLDCIWKKACKLRNKAALALVAKRATRRRLCCSRVENCELPPSEHLTVWDTHARPPCSRSADYPLEYAGLLPAAEEIAKMETWPG